MTTANPTANGNGTTMNDRLAAAILVPPGDDPGFVILVVALCLLMSTLRPTVFLTTDNLLNQGRLMPRRSALIALADDASSSSLAGIDLSVGSIAWPDRDHAGRGLAQYGACPSSSPS